MTADGHPISGPPEALGQSEEFLDFQERLSRAAKVDRPVLLIGERGHRQGAGRGPAPLSLAPLAGPPGRP